MKQVNRTVSKVVFSALLVLVIFWGCQSEQPLNPDREQVIENCIELYTRLKVGDNSVIYDNEFPYMREERDREEYVALPAIAAYRADTLMAIQIDSISLWEDTAYAHLRTEYILSDSTLIVHSIRLRWHKVDGEWLRPTLSHLKRQKEFEDELRVYWDAVREIEAREKARQEQKEETGP